MRAAHASEALPVLCTSAGQNLLTGIVVDLVIGGLCLLGFVVWRRTFPIYQARLYNSDARFRPAELRVDGHRRIWCVAVAPVCVRGGGDWPGTG